MTASSLKPHQFDSSTTGESSLVRPDVLSISVLGNMSLAFNGRDVKIKSRKSRAVLAFLALSESRQETRERLVGLFWSESEEQKARGSLRQTLRELRQALLDVGYLGLQTEKLAIELEPKNLEVDLWSIIHAAEQQRAHPLVLNTPRVAETVLAGLEDIDPEFRVWLLAKRQTFHDRLIRGLESGLVGTGADPQNKKLLAEAIINLDPTHEDACRCLMQARAEEGDVAGGLRVYKVLWDLLDDEYGMEPSAKTQQLVADIKQGNFERAQPDPSPATVRSHIPDSGSGPQTFNAARLAQLHQLPSAATVTPPSKIALLVSQFQMNGVAPDKAHLVHGFRHHLIASLIRFREWSVVDDVAAPAATQRRPLHAAQYVIDATAYQAGAVANVILTLRQNETGTFIWSENFELKLENWFEAQQRVIRRTTTSLNVQLSTERLMRLAREPDVSLEVYDRWLRGQEMIFSFSPDNWKRAAQIFADVIREAPHFSSSYNSLVQLNNTVHLTHPGIFRDLSKTKETIALARTAAQLDPVDFRAQLHLGWSLTLAEQHAEAEVHMDLARELNENDPWTLMSSALYYAFSGKFDRAEKLADDAAELALAPGSLFLGYQAVIRFLCGNYLGAAEVVDHALIATIPAWKAAALHHLGRHEESAREAERFLNGARTAWFGNAPPTDAAIAHWLLHSHPISRREDWERLRDGIHGAGIPVSGLDHQKW